MLSSSRNNSSTPKNKISLGGSHFGGVINVDPRKQEAFNLIKETIIETLENPEGCNFYTLKGFKNIYIIRSNKGDRIIFYKTYYNNAPFLVYINHGKHKDMDQYETKDEKRENNKRNIFQSEIERALAQSDNPDNFINLLETEETEVKSIFYRSTDDAAASTQPIFFGDQLILLDDKQAPVMTVYPCIAIGVPGGGKSALSNGVLNQAGKNLIRVQEHIVDTMEEEEEKEKENKNYRQECVYVTLSSHLANSMADKYWKDPTIDPYAPITFISYMDLLYKLVPYLAPPNYFEDKEEINKTTDPVKKLTLLIKFNKKMQVWEEKHIRGKKHFNVWVADFHNKKNLVKKKNKPAIETIQCTKNFFERSDRFYEELQVIAVMSEQEYVTLTGKRATNFPDPDDRKWLYSAGEQYLGDLQKWSAPTNSQGKKQDPIFDPNLFLIPNEYLLKYFNLSIDEFQDLSYVQLDNLLKMVQPEYKYLQFYGDMHQSLVDHKSKLNFLTQKLIENKWVKIEEIKNHVINLNKSYRCASSIIQFLNRVINAKLISNGGRSADEEYTHIESAPDAPVGKMSWINTLDPELIDQIKLQHAGDEDFAVIVPLEFYDEANYVFAPSKETGNKQVNVYTVGQSKGREFAKVLLYKTLDTQEMLAADSDFNNKIKKRLEDKNATESLVPTNKQKHEKDDKHQIVYNALLTAGSRAKEQLIVFHQKKNQLTNFLEMDEKDYLESRLSNQMYVPKPKAQPSFFSPSANTNKVEPRILTIEEKYKLAEQLLENASNPNLTQKEVTALNEKAQALLNEIKNEEEATSIKSQPNSVSSISDEAGEPTRIQALPSKPNEHASKQKKKAKKALTEAKPAPETQVKKSSNAEKSPLSNAKVDKPNNGIKKYMSDMLEILNISNEQERKKKLSNKLKTLFASKDASCYLFKDLERNKTYLFWELFLNPKIPAAIRQSNWQVLSDLTVENVLNVDKKEKNVSHIFSRKYFINIDKLSSHLDIITIDKEMLDNYLKCCVSYKDVNNPLIISLVEQLSNDSFDRFFLLYMMLGINEGMELLDWLHKNKELLNFDWLRNVKIIFEANNYRNFFYDNERPIAMMGSRFGMMLTNINGVRILNHLICQDAMTAEKLKGFFDNPDFTQYIQPNLAKGVTLVIIQKIFMEILRYPFTMTQAILKQDYLFPPLTKSSAMTLFDILWDIHQSVVLHFTNSLFQTDPNTVNNLVKKVNDAARETIIKELLHTKKQLQKLDTAFAEYNKGVIDATALDEVLSKPNALSYLFEYIISKEMPFTRFEKYFNTKMDTNLASKVMAWKNLLAKLSVGTNATHPLMANLFENRVYFKQFMIALVRMENEKPGVILASCPALYNKLMSFTETSPQPLMQFSKLKDFMEFKSGQIYTYHFTKWMEDKSDKKIWFDFLASYFNPNSYGQGQINKPIVYFNFSLLLSHVQGIELLHSIFQYRPDLLNELQKWVSLVPLKDDWDISFVSTILIFLKDINFHRNKNFEEEIKNGTFLSGLNIPNNSILIPYGLEFEAIFSDNATLNKLTSMILQHSDLFFKSVNPSKDSSIFVTFLREGIAPIANLYVNNRFNAASGFSSAFSKACILHWCENRYDFQYECLELLKNEYGLKLFYYMLLDNADKLWFKKLLMGFPDHFAITIKRALIYFQQNAVLRKIGDELIVLLRQYVPYFNINEDKYLAQVYLLDKAGKQQLIVPLLKTDSPNDTIFSVMQENPLDKSTLPLRFEDWFIAKEGDSYKDAYRKEINQRLFTAVCKQFPEYYFALLDAVMNDERTERLWTNQLAFDVKFELTLIEIVISHPQAIEHNVFTNPKFINWLRGASDSESIANTYCTTLLLHADDPAKAADYTRIRSAMLEMFSLCMEFDLSICHILCSSKQGYQLFLAILQKLDLTQEESQKLITEELLTTAVQDVGQNPRPSLLKLLVSQSINGDDCLMGLSFLINLNPCAFERQDEYFFLQPIDNLHVKSKKNISLPMDNSILMILAKNKDFKLIDKIVRTNMQLNANKELKQWVKNLYLPEATLSEGHGLFANINVNSNANSSGKNQKNATRNKTT